MIKAERLKEGDKVAIVSLSSGVLGEEFVRHEVELIEKRLPEMGLRFEYMENARKGIKYLAGHPEAKAADLRQAFSDPEVKMVWCAIGGEDSFRTLPYLLNEEFAAIVRENPKIFMGFSDTTMSHLMFYKMGLSTYYGPALLPDVAELSPEMLPYVKSWLKELFSPTESREIEISPTWYKNRESFGPEQVGVPAPAEEEKHGMEFFGPEKKVEGELLGGCMEILYETIAAERFSDMKEVFEKYPIFPEDWAGKMLFIEPSDEQPTPEKFRKMLEAIEGRGVFEEISGMLVGKPMDEKYYEEYRTIIKEYTDKYDVATVYNMNFGHSEPRGILPYGQKAEIDAVARKVRLLEPMVR